MIAEAGIGQVPAPRTRAAGGALPALLGGAVVAIPAVEVVVLAHLRASTRPLATLAIEMVAMVSLGLTGALVLSGQPGNRFGRLLLAVALFGEVQLVGLHLYASAALQDAGLPGGAAALAFDSGSFAPYSYLLVTVLPLAFPTGRLCSRGTRWTAALGGAGAVMVFLPLAVLAVPGMLLLFGSFVAAGVFVTLRWRRAQGVERRQLTLFLGPALLLIADMFVCLAGAAARTQPLQPWASTGTLVLVAGIAVATLRYRLWELDLVVNRTLVYAALTAIVLGLYGGIVLAFGAALQGRAAVLPSFAATAAVAIGVQPLRQLLQRGVDRLMYGRRREPLSVLAGVGRRLAAATSETLLSDVVEEVGQALRLGHLAVQVGDGSGEVAVRAHGAESGSAGLPIPLVFQGEAVGMLLAAPRRGEALRARERRLLGDLAPQLAVAVHSVRLTNDLRRSRERLVAALEDERRRLRRDLHDGLGPTLTAVTLQMDAARTRLRHDPVAADAMLAEVRADVTGAIHEIRRLVYDLRPPALDELGLVGALRQQAGKFRDLEVAVHAPAGLPELPAAVEVAAYRIAAEAVTNAARHAKARRCAVRLTAGAELVVEVSDDGCGMDQVRPGVGLSSMGERVMELGGILCIDTAPSGGTRVWARLPLHVPVTRR